MPAALTMSTLTQRRFILGQQGLWPGRRWRGRDGVLQAIRANAVIQIDPLNVVARSHDIVLYGRVLDYRPDLLDTLLYTGRAGFDWGGTVLIYPMEELPYWRVVMERKRHEKRWETFAAEHGPVIDAVRDEVARRGPLGTRDIEGSTIKTGSFRTGKDSGRALYYLWLAGELMTHSRRGFDRLYDLRERIAPPHVQHAASAEEADAYFARKLFRELGMVRAKGWRAWFAGTIERKVTPDEAAARLDALLAAGEVVPVALEGDRELRYLLASDLPLLETVHAGSVPDAWQPLDTTTTQEAVFLAPLEIVSTRGRALPLFGFEYLWEVYKPEHKRRWGYYTLPVLYEDQLVARFDPKLDRSTRTLLIKGFWLEKDAALDGPFAAALRAGFARFRQFVGAESLNFAETVPAGVREALSD